ncbi:MAG: hypothetical protein ACERKD_07645 [Prolixibacteraceae bacterium]
MNHIQFKCLLFSLLLLMFSSCKQTNESKSLYYTFHQSHTGGGGYITGFIQNAINPDIFYARCDVAGVFKTVNHGVSWETVNNGMTEWHHHSVRSIAIDQKNPEILFRCSGDAREGKIFGTIHRSTNGGKDWQIVTDKLDFYGNGPTRMLGELIEVDPFNSNNVVSGSYSQGIWSSNDGGVNWKYCGLKGERFSFVKFHPYKKGIILAGTVSDNNAIDAHYTDKNQSIADRMKEYHDFERGTVGKLYLSENAGVTWKKAVEREGFSFSDASFLKNELDKVIIAALDSGIFSYYLATNNFQKSMNGLPDRMPYYTVTTNQHNGQTLYTAAATPNEIDQTIPIPIFVSNDLGKSWNVLAQHTMENLKNYPEYVAYPAFAGWAISKVKVDEGNTNGLIYSNWYGVAFSNDKGKNWDGKFFNGMETSCLESIVSDPEIPGKTYFTLCDHPPFVSNNNGKTYHATTRNQNYYASTCLVASKHQPGVIIYGALNGNERKSAIIKTDTTFNELHLMKELGTDLFVQALREDPFVAGGFWAYFDGEIESGAGLYNSNDWGETWSKINIDLISDFQTLPREQHLVDAEILSIAVYQEKNICGTNKLLEIDPFVKDRIYFAEPSTGIFISKDGGVTWSLSKGLPVKKSAYSILTAIKADPYRKGWIYASFVKEGLWLSKDFGTKWSKLCPSNNNSLNVSDMDIDKDFLAICCEPLGLSNGKSEVFVAGFPKLNFESITDPKLGSIRWKSISIDHQTKTINLASAGNGSFYAVLQH